MMRCSLGTAKVLGLKQVKVDALPTTAYLMLGERCRFDCAFCAQARESSSRADLLSRVSWPDFPAERVLAALAAPQAKETIQRVCFQVIQEPAALAAAKDLVGAVQSCTPAPICVSAGPQSLEEIAELLALGVDHVSIALDAATPQVYARVKDGSWERRHALLVEAARRFPGRLATHLIVGLGESEEEMLKRIQEMLDLGITVALFAFTPVRGTRLEDAPRPELVVYRRMQVGRYLFALGATRYERCRFDQGRVTEFGLSEQELYGLLRDGEAFRTSGCSGCNRPYYNETPGEELYNYPRPLTEEEAARAWTEVKSGLWF